MIAELKNWDLFERLPLLCVALIACLLLVRYSATRGMTLRGSLHWLLVALLTNGIIEATIAATAEPTRGWTTALRFVAATSLCCPQMSVLGAKRPQDRAWHAIVLSLWMVLILPAAEGYFVRRSGALEVHDARGWFLWILIAIGWANYLPTRRWVSATCYALAQVILMAEHLPLLRATPSVTMRNVAWVALVMGAVVVACERPHPTKDRLSRLWLTFRDAYGAVWSLRLMDRLNQTADVAQWPVRVEWDGIRSPQAESLTEKQQRSLERCLRTVLRRFVDPDWMTRFLS